MTNTDELVARLRSCDKPVTNPNGCKLCPFYYEVQVEQFLYECRCAAEDAAGEIERLERML